MASRTRYIEFANFVCKFGELDLLNLAEDVVVPAFFDRSLERNFEKAQTKYFFHRVELVEIESGETPILAIAGRLIKDTVLVRSQYFDAESDDLVQRELELRNAPSAFFLLILNDHRLIYLRETGDAPLLSTFGTTARIFIRRKHKAFIDLQVQEAKSNTAKDNAPRVTRASILEDYPKPDVELIPLAGGDATDDFLERFNLLRSLRFRLVRPNADEFRGRSFIKQAFPEMEQLNARHAGLNFENSDGLNLSSAKQQIKQALGTENTEVTFLGEDESGHKLKGNNEDVQLRIPFIDDSVIENITTTAKRLYSEYVKARQGNLLRVETTSNPNLRELLKPLQSKLNELNQRSRQSSKNLRD